MNAYDEVLFEEMKGKHGDLGIITLNRPHALDALNHMMIHLLYARLSTWAEAKQIKAVIIRAVEGRAFCAGGDIRSTYERMKTQDSTLSQFFYDEYQLNRLIFHFPKPYIALLDGITMGGGVGISIHGSHRIATDRLLFAMPETGIGFFPDVGGTYFLPRLPKQMGCYLGLTGARIASDDCVALGIAQYKISNDSFPDLIKAIAQQVFDHDARHSVTEIIEQFKLSTGMPVLIDQQDAIENCFSAKTIETILERLEQSPHTICKEAAHIITRKSPTSLKVTLRALQQGKQLDFDTCMKQEYRLAWHFLQGHDFLEGIRAVIIDKDLSPIWNPATLSSVTDDQIDQYFMPVMEELA